MKKSILALAILGTFAGAASAQSSVTLEGTIDLNARYVKNAGQDRRVSMGNNGLNAGQLVFSGTEDLGGGLAASFQLNAGLFADTGNSSIEDAFEQRFFTRRATVSLSGGFGEIRLGRDYTPTFLTGAIYDAFGNLGVASTLNVIQAPVLNTLVRADNAISYFLPSKIGGVYGQVMVASAEGNAAVANPGRYVGGRVGFAAGPFDVSAAASEQRINASGVNAKTYNVGGSYDLGVAKILGYAHRDTRGTGRETRGSIGVVVPMGQGEVHASYARSKSNFSGADNAINQLGLGYVYSLSKRTAVYSTVSRLSNGGLSTNSVASFTSGSQNSLGRAALGGNSTGFEFGVRHFF